MPKEDFLLPHSCVKPFLISFAVAFFSLSVLGMAAALTAKPFEAPKEDTPANSLYLPQIKDSLTLLLIGLQEDSVPPMSFMLLRFHPAKGSIPIACLPGNCVVTLEQQPSTLSMLYEKEGVSAVRKALAESFAVSIDRCGEVPLEGFEKIVTLIGHTNFEIPHEMKIRQGKLSFQLSAGIQRIDGKKAKALAVYEGFSCQQEKCDLLSNLARDAINQHLSLVSSELADRLFRGVVNQMRSDLSYEDYANRRQAAVFMAQLKRRPAVAILPQLRSNPDATCSLCEESALILKKRFGAEP